MLNNLETKPRSRPSILGGASKRPNLSLNLHMMPRTVVGHWKKWLILGLVILGIFTIVSWLLYSFTK